MERCRREIEAIEAEILGSDWCVELRILRNEERRQAETQRRQADTMNGTQTLTE